MARQADTLGVRVVLLRIGLVLGREGDMLRPMRLAYRLGQWMPWIHLQDVLGLIRHAIADTSLARSMRRRRGSCATRI